MDDNQVQEVPVANAAGVDKAAQELDAALITCVEKDIPIPMVVNMMTML